MPSSGVSLSIKDTGRLKLYETVDLEVELGVLPEDGGKTHAGSGLTLAELGEIHEFGAGSIPARAWLRGWFDLNLAKMKSAFRDELRRQGQAQQYSPKRLEQLAAHQSASLRQRILDGHIKPPNKADTLRRKAPETRPLIETKEFVEALKAKFLFFGKNRKTGDDFEVEWREGKGEE